MVASLLQSREGKQFPTFLVSPMDELQKLAVFLRVELPAELRLEDYAHLVQSRQTVSSLLEGLRCSPSHQKFA